MVRVISIDLENQALRINVWTVLNRIELECEEQVARRLITREQADWRIRNARQIAAYLLADREN